MWDFDLTRVIGAKRLKFRKIIGDSAGSRGKRRVKDVHELAFAGNHEVSANTPDLSRLARASGLLARLTVEQFRISCHNVISVLCFYSADIGLVSPCDRSIGPAGPNRMQERVEEETEVIKLRRLFPVKGAQTHQFQAIAGNVAHAKNGPAPDGATLGFEVAAIVADEVEVKSLTALPQARNIRLHDDRLLRRKPTAESQYASRQGRVECEANIALNLWLI